MRSKNFTYFLLLFPLMALLACALWAFVPGASFWLILLPVVLSAAAFSQAYFRLGWRQALCISILALGLSFLLEVLNQATGMVAARRFTELMGPRFLGVPVVHALYFFPLFYGSHGTAQFMVEGRLRNGRMAGLRMACLALLTGLLVAAGDLTLDPMMVQRGAWHWLSPSGFCGIPFASFIHWTALGFVASLLFRVMELDFQATEPIAESPAMDALPMLVPALFGVLAMHAGLPGGLALIPPFSVGFAVMAAVGRVLQAMRNPEAVLETSSPESLPESIQ